MSARLLPTLALGLITASASFAQTERPNIVLILSDDHSAPYLGCQGEPALKTPHLDQFATEGIRFDRAFTTAPQCVPSRASIMTGRSPVGARMVRFTAPLPADVPALPDLLGKAGYYTGACRRYYHLDGPGGARAGGTTAEIYARLQLPNFAQRLDFVDTTGNRSQTPAIVDAFLDQVPQGRPFFFWVNTSDPHHPWDSSAVDPPVDPSAIRVPPDLPDLPGVREDLARYMGEVERLDGEFQWVIEALARRGLDKNTIVVFMGDNGMAFPHGKGSLYDPGLNVPLIVRWPGVVKPGQISTDLISGEDLAPTFLEVAGVPAPPGMTGVSFLPLLKGEPFTPRTHIFGERGPHGSATFNEKSRANGFDLSRCVRSDRFKLIYNCTPYQEYSPVDSANGPGWKEIVAAHEAGTLAPEFDRAYFTRPRPVYELFDLDADPGELNNLAGQSQYAAIERELKTALQEKMIIDSDFLPLPLTD